MTICMNGKEYELSTKLRVAYKIQGDNAHKPYTKIFSEIGDMTLEKQIELLYAAFSVGNPEDAKFITKQQFLDYYLDNYDLGTVMSQLEELVNGILGEKGRQIADGAKDEEKN